MSEIAKRLPKSATGLKLYRIDSKERLLGCETVYFTRGWEGVEIVLRRASLSGRVDVGGNVDDHFADVLDATESLIETVALDRKSYSALKNHWMRTKLDYLTLIDLGRLPYPEPCP